jgi:hypothetical protein
MNIDHSSSIQVSVAALMARADQQGSDGHGVLRAATAYAAFVPVA